MTVAAAAPPPDSLAERKAANVEDLLARFERVIAANPEAPISKYCARRRAPLMMAIRRHRRDT